MASFDIKTNRNQFRVEYFSEFVPKQQINLNKKCFNKMCKQGCINYNKKYSCPPFVPNFHELTSDKGGLLIILFKCNLNQINSTEYNKIRIANIVMKSRIEKLMRFLEGKFNTSFLSTGSCRLCKPCKLRLKQPCKYPDKRRYSLEATGVDCNKLSKDLFNIELRWYKNKTSPEYSCVICGLLCNEKEQQQIKKAVEDYLIKLNEPASSQFASHRTLSFRKRNSSEVENLDCVVQSKLLVI